jgi:hypothetical protein
VPGTFWAKHRAPTPVGQGRSGKRFLTPLILTFILPVAGIFHMYSLSPLQRPRGGNDILSPRDQHLPMVILEVDLPIGRKLLLTERANCLGTNGCGIMRS